MNRILIFNTEKKENDLFLIEDTYQMNHINKVLKAKVGDQIKVCLLNEGLALGEIAFISASSAAIKIINYESSHQAKYHLEIALCRPPTCKKVLEHGTSLGAASFRFFHAALSEKSYAESHLFKKAEYKKYLRDGLSQSAIFHQEPSVIIEKPHLKPHSQNKQRFFLSLNQGVSFADQKGKIDFSKEITLAFGPERGWTDQEEKELLAADYQPVTLGPNILRVEIACFSALGQLNLLAMKS